MVKNDIKTSHNFGLNRILLLLFLVSFCVISTEILVTRISSVIFVNSFAFIMLSLAILGLGIGGMIIFWQTERSAETNSSRKVERSDSDYTNTSTRLVFYLLNIKAISLILFIVLVGKWSGMQHPVIFFGFILIPLISAGMVFAVIFRLFASVSFKIYAADLAGASIGAVLVIFLIPLLGPLQALFILALLLVAGSMIVWPFKSATIVKGLVPVFLLLTCLYVGFKGSDDIFGSVPVGDYPEKDIHHVYDRNFVRSEIIESRWSIFGRSDLVSHSNQDVVQHLFVDGAAGSQMYRFSGKPGDESDRIVYDQLLGHTSTLPLLLLNDEEKRTMLVIGPGGGKEILAGLIFGVDHITGVEINPDFVRMVETHAAFNGGLYTNYPNVDIQIGEGRQFVRQQDQMFNIITMVLPSTQQVQNIENYALSENYLLTKEAIADYMNVLSNNGRLIFSVYNQIELIKLINTVAYVFYNQGLHTTDILNRLMIVDHPTTPTLIVTKSEIAPEMVGRYQSFMQQIPPGYPTFSFLPYTWNDLPSTPVNNYLKSLYNERTGIEALISGSRYNIRPVSDNSPFFYHIERGLPKGLIVILSSVLVVGIVVSLFPFVLIQKTQLIAQRSHVIQNLILFTLLGIGFMLLEVSLFNKLVLYLGTPTISLSVLLFAMLSGMGIGSYSASLVRSLSNDKKIRYASTIAVIYALLLTFGAPVLLSNLLSSGLAVRIVVAFILLLPLGVFLGVPFPTLIRRLYEDQLDRMVPWMYGVNGVMSVLGSTLAIVISMLFGFREAMIAGVGAYLLVVLLCRPKK